MWSKAALGRRPSEISQAAPFHASEARLIPTRRRSVRTMSVGDGTPRFIHSAGDAAYSRRRSASPDASPAPQPVETDREADLCERLADCARLLAIAERDRQAHANEAVLLRAKAGAARSTRNCAGQNQ